MKKLLVTRESACLQPLRELIEKQKHRTLVLWTIECANSILPIFEEKYPQDKRPREAIEAAKAWANGKIKMPIAKKAAHATHNAATAVAEEDPAACAAARAIGHVVGIIHVETHALGFVIYAITAFVYAARKKDADDVIAKKCKWLYDSLLYWEANIDKEKRIWASFLLNDNVPNKEKLARQKKEQK
ncbi:MAG: hypothetical protein COT15_01205 [Candidatus Diapherotrites archaeon CG08_land_8_20_14_0_20_34_12]|nr:MAG: hypothetical protein COT15_01205 [Candidatus Diapherotrites archaeon CG08_land_8_20_14_0_20_34_12]